VAPSTRVLLTGAAGFVGSHLTDRLVASGAFVIGVDNLVTGRLANLAAATGTGSFNFIEADVTSPLEVEGSLDWVLHFASPASPPRYLERPVETLRVNAEGTRQLLELARAKGAGFLLASTSEVYGDPLVHPQPESYSGNVNPVGPRSVYDEGKRYAEAMATAYNTSFETPVRICRIFNTYGPRMDPADGRVVSNLISQALAGAPMTIYGDGSQTRSFQYIDDLVEGVMALLRTDVSGPVNLGNPSETTVLELAELVRELTGSTSPIHRRPLPEDDPRRRKPDISRATSLLGWRPVVPLREGLKRTIDAYRALDLVATRA
jgi:dTDP-glucose 4,6-dehydratase